MNDELERMWKEADVLPQHSPGGTEGNYENPSVRMAVYWIYMTIRKINNYFLKQH
jgi:hypothetical protein